MQVPVAGSHEQIGDLKSPTAFSTASRGMRTAWKPRVFDYLRNVTVLCTRQIRNGAVSPLFRCKKNRRNPKSALELLIHVVTVLAKAAKRRLLSLFLSL